MSRNGTEEAVSVVSFISGSIVCDNGIKLAKFGLLIDTPSSI